MMHMYSRLRASDRLRLLAWAAIIAVAAPAAFAQVPPVLPQLAPEDPAQRLLREQRQRELEREATQPPVKIDTPAAMGAEQPVEAVPETAATFEIHRIAVQGNTLLSEREIEAITAAFVGRALGTNRINLL